MAAVVGGGLAGLALAMGCDMVNVGRTAMFSIGCIQAQRACLGRLIWKQSKP